MKKSKCKLNFRRELCQILGKTTFLTRKKPEKLIELIGGTKNELFFLLQMLNSTASDQTKPKEVKVRPFFIIIWNCNFSQKIFIKKQNIRGDERKLLQIVQIE